MNLNEMLHLESTRDLKPGDFFLWESAQTGKREIHQFHSDAGYGIKTWTGYNPENGSSLLVNWSGVHGKLTTFDNPVSDYEEVLGPGWAEKG